MKLSFAHWTLLLLLFSGCGYTLVGTGSTLPDHIKSLAIPVLENDSSEPEIHRDLTDALRQAFIEDGRLKLMKEDQADLVMRGTLKYYNLRAVAFNDNDVPTEYFVELKLNVKVMDHIKNKVFLKQKLDTKWDYKSDTNVVNADASRNEALDEAYQELASRLVSLLIEQF